jgi:hypothetical protein
VDGSVVATDSYKVSVYYHYIYYDNMYYTVQVRIDERIDYFSINVENMNTMMMNTYVYHRNDYLTNNPIISSILGYDLSKIESEIVKPPRNIEYLENLMLKRILDTI